MGGARPRQAQPDSLEAAPLEQYRIECAAAGVAPSVSVQHQLPSAGADVKVLDCSSTYIGPRGVAALLPLLSLWHNLERVDFSANGLTSDEAAQVGAVLLHHPCITSVELGGNPLVEDRIARGELTQLLRGRRRITHLGLSGCELISPCALRRIAALLAANRAHCAASDSSWRPQPQPEAPPRPQSAPLQP
eukprot:TRINITY_DN22939_c0_g1_i1.p2 TRINITY_DN22939_c0_g1~~TRINITY_DN22939_c0_g1_i1.p2  ORF type:complete len:220 (+),score=66.22 TRINITY_DN22939_c0_g1_i1:90-662(+)